MSSFSCDDSNYGITSFPWADNAGLCQTPLYGHRLRSFCIRRNANGAMQMAQRNAVTNPNPNPNLLTRHLRCAICIAPNTDSPG